MFKSIIAAAAAMAMLSTAAIAQDSSNSIGLSLTSSAPDASGPIDLTLNGPSSEMETGSSSMMPTSDVLSSYTRVDTDRLSSKIVGSPVYSSTATDADNFGNINDLVLDANGQVVAVVIGVGGFLGLGEKQVAVDYSALQWTVAADNTERYVLQTTRDALTSAPDFQTVDDEPDASNASSAMDTDASMMDSSMMTPPADTSAIGSPGMSSALMDNSMMTSSSAPATDMTPSTPTDTISSMSSTMGTGTSMASSAMDGAMSMGSSAMDSMSTGASAMAPTTSAP